LHDQDDSTGARNAQVSLPQLADTDAGWPENFVSHASSEKQWIVDVSHVESRFDTQYERGPRRQAIPSPTRTSKALAGSGTAGDSGSAEGSAAPLPAPSEAPKLLRQTV